MYILKNLGYKQKPDIHLRNVVQTDWIKILEIKVKVLLGYIVHTQLETPNDWLVTQRMNMLYHALESTDGQNHHMLMILKSKSNHLNKGDLKSKSFWMWWFDNQNHIENQMILKSFSKSF